MTLRLQTLHLLMALVLSVTGCAANKHLTGPRAAGGGSPLTFWPPPPSTTLWVSEDGYPGKAENLVEAAAELAALLSEAGYSERRWYPIGVGFSHGFAVTTQLEKVDARASNLESDRWTVRYAQAATLKWLTQVRSLKVPEPGRYRVFLAAVTDLPRASTQTPPVWNQHTVMAGPGIPEELAERDMPKQHRVSDLHRLEVYAYTFERNEDASPGEAVRMAPTEGPSALLLGPFKKFRASLEVPSQRPSD